MSDNLIRVLVVEEHPQRLALERVSIAPTGAAMVYAKAFAVGVVTGVLAPIVAAAASLVWLLMTVFGGGFAATGGVRWPVSVFIVSRWNISPKPIVIQMAVGFAIGFLFSLWTDLVTTHGTR